jgi:Mce-associated membrane protein
MVIATDEANSAAEATDEDGETAALETDDGSIALTDRRGRRMYRPTVPRWFAFVALPMTVLLVCLGAGLLKWQVNTTRGAELARTESTQVAKDSVVAMLSYSAESAAKDLESALTRLTGPFQGEYRDMITKVVIPGSQQQHISVAATAPAAAPVSASSHHAVVLVYVNQATTVGNTAPSELQSSIRITLDKVDGRWLVSGFDPM